MILCLHEQPLIVVLNKLQIMLCCTSSFLEQSGDKSPLDIFHAKLLLVLVKLIMFCFQDPEQLQDKSNEILTAIIQGMRKEEPSNNVKLAATNALLNSLEFTKANFDKEVGNGWLLMCVRDEKKCKAYEKWWWKQGIIL